MMEDQCATDFYGDDIHALRADDYARQVRQCALLTRLGARDPDQPHDEGDDGWAGK